MRVLVIDDAAAIRFALGRILVSLGHDVTGEAATLDAGVELARALAPDAIALDGRLVAGDVAAGIARVRAAAPGAALVTIVARDERELLRDALAAGATSAIRRPILRSSVVAAFERGTHASVGESRMLHTGDPRNEPHG